jgi:hypothetical protein
MAILELNRRTHAVAKERLISYTRTVLGGVAEWTMATVLKTVFAKANVGSNPTPSAENSLKLNLGNYFMR